MKKFEDNGFTTIVTSDKIKIEIPIANLICAFENSPDNMCENGEPMTVKRGKRQDFAEFIAGNLLSEKDSETGETYISGAFDGVFTLLFEGYAIGDDFVNYPDVESGYDE
jgi:hypothetical protein